MALTGTCKTFNAMKGWGFIDMGGSDVFVHINDCVGGSQPKDGDILSFDVVPRPNNPEHMQAKNCTGGTGVRSQVPGFAGPVQGTGAYTGTVKFMGSKGYGFITAADGTDVFMNIKDCVGSKPVSGDTVKYDITASDNKPGMMQARNITGGTAPLDPMGGKGGFDAWAWVVAGAKVAIAGARVCRALVAAVVVMAAAVVATAVEAVVMVEASKVA
jgi:cold shock CspA family protein